MEGKENESGNKEQFNQYFLQLVLGLQGTAWMALGKQMNPMTGKSEVSLDMARDSIDTLLMLKDKTKGNLTGVEKGLLENAMQDLELNFIEVSKEEEKKGKDKEGKEESKKEENKQGKEQDTKKEEEKKK